MKIRLTFIIVLTAFLVSCSGLDSGEKFIGNWENVLLEAKMTITRDGDIFTINVHGATMANDGIYTAKLEGGSLKEINPKRTYSETWTLKKNGIRFGGTFFSKKN